VAATPQRRRRGWPASTVDRLGSRSGAARSAVAAVVLGIVGGVVLVVQPFARVAVTGPGAETGGLPPVVGPAGNGLIAFSHDGDILVGDPATGESQVIVPGELGIGPEFSPDGTHIAYGRRHQLDPKGTCDIVVVRPDGSDERVIATEEDGVGCQPVWTPDSRSVVVVSRAMPARILLDAAGLADPVPLSDDLAYPGRSMRPRMVIAS
jgi:hypothetical protein